MKLRQVRLSEEVRDLNGLDSSFGEYESKSNSLKIPICKFKINDDEGDLLEWRNLELLNCTFAELVFVHGFEAILKEGSIVGVENLPKSITTYNSERDEYYVLKYGCFERQEITFVESNADVEDENPYVYGRRRAKVEVFKKKDDPFDKPFVTHREIEYLIGLENSIEQTNDNSHNPVDFNYPSVDDFVVGSPMYKHVVGESFIWFDKVKSKESPDWVKEYNELHK